MSEFTVKIHPTLQSSIKVEKFKHNEQVIDVSKEISIIFNNIAQKDIESQVFDDVKKINLDATLDKKKKCININKFYLIHENGHVEIINNSHKIPFSKHRNNILKRKKVGVLSMGWLTPPSDVIYGFKDIYNSFKENLTLNIFMTAGIGSSLNHFFNISIVNVIFGIFILAFMECILSYFPGAVKEGTESDHKLQAKIWRFGANMFFVSLGTLAQHFLIKSMNKPPIYISHLGVMVAYLICSIYITSSVKRILRINKVKAPEVNLDFIKQFIKK